MAILQAARFRHVNRVLAELAGYRSTELVGRPFTDYLHPADLPALLEWFRRRSAGAPAPPTVEARIRRKDGAYLLTEVAVDLVDYGGQPANLVVVRELTDGRRLARALQQQTEYYEGLVESLGDWVWETDTTGRYTYSNRAVETFRGHSAGEVVGRSVTDLWGDGTDSAVQRAQLRESLAAGKGWQNYPRSFRHEDGSTVHFESTAVPIFDGQGNVSGYRGIDRNTTARRQAELQLQATERKIEQLHEAALRLAHCETEEQVFRRTVQAAKEILAFRACSLDVVQGDKLVAKATTPDAPAGARAETPLTEDSLASLTYRTKASFLFGSLDEVPTARPVDGRIQSGISLPLADFGVFQVAAFRPRAFTEEDARLLELLLRHSSETLRRLRLQLQLREQAIRDPLTGAYNRRYFAEVIDREVARARRYGHPIGFLIIDVDRFKEINDRFGHAAGDRVLRLVAKALQGQARAADLVIRYGGDEFLVVLPEAAARAEQVADRLRQAVAQGDNGDLVPFPITLAIGSAVWEPRQPRPVEVALHEADQRMYGDKAHHR
ncbi:MAG: diguanylate cyclase [Candidatus Bipolaricaulaceae bacterium]